MKIVLLTILIVLTLIGCKDIQEIKQTLDTYTTYQSDTNNTGAIQNSLGYIGHNTNFGNIKIVGNWVESIPDSNETIKIHRFNNNGDYTFKFHLTGNPYRKDYTGTFHKYYYHYGVSEDGNSLTLDDDTSYIIDSQPNSNCYNMYEYTSDDYYYVQWCKLSTNQ